jgi:NAD+ synthetase
VLRIAIAQLDPVVGAFEANVRKLEEAYQRACLQQARFLLTPELGVCGYPPYDLIERPEMIEKNDRAIQDLLAMTRGQKCALVVGHISQNPSKSGRLAQNTVSVLENGSCVFRQAKTLLPTYDVFDEARYFEPAHDIHLWNCDGHPIGLAICEDLWGEDTLFGRKYYGQDPVKCYQDQGAQLVCSISASPYYWGKSQKRQKLHQDVAKKLKVPLVYVNQVGATDEVLFDGGSFILNSDGKLLNQLPYFQQGFGTVTVQNVSELSFEPGSDWAAGTPDELEDIEILAKGLVTGIRDYFTTTGFKKAILGLSGGIDSAVVATLAVRALGEKNVLGIAMPSQHSSAHSLEDAELLAKSLKIPLEVKPIKFLFSTASRELSERRGQLAPLALENLQSRLRSLILMTLSNHENALVLTTGNKSELAMGYCTLYGDMAGALAPIGDLFKTRVYQLARHINQKWGSPIPERSISKAPSAELRPNQTDQDTLPPYEVLDELLEGYLEKGMSGAELSAKFDEKDLGQLKSVKEVLHRLELNEYKRRQAAPVLKVSPKAFGIGRRVPIAKKWD